ncbi:MAG: TolC family protein [Armatimonadota bacterium]
MKKLFPVLAVLLLAAGASAEPLSLAECVNQALAQNPAVSISEEGMRKADADIDEAFAAGRPKLTLKGSYVRLNEAATMTFGDEIINLGSADDRSADLVLAQPIDAFGIIRTGKRAASANRSAFEYGYEAQINDTTLEAKTAFFTVLRAQEFLRVQSETVTQLEAHLADAELNLQAGTIAKFDVLRAQTELADARQGLISAQNGVDLAKASLNAVLGRPVDEPVEPADPGRPEFIDIPIDRCVDSACNYRPEARRADAQVSLSRELTSIAEKSRMPSINLTWSYNHDFDVIASSPASSWQAILGASFKLYDGGENKAVVERAQSDTRSAQAMREQTTLAISLDARQAYLGLKESKERITAAETALEQAREAMRLADVRYKAGVSTQLELLDARAALTRAETNHVNALYDYQIALAKLERAVGGQARMTSLISSSQPSALGY